MNDQGDSAVIDMGERRSGPVRRMFAARIGRFDDPAERALIDELATWIEDTYREELTSRPSKHVYLRTLPDDITAKIDRLRDSDVK